MFFFTVGTLIGCRVRFDSLDSFLKFLLEGLLEKLSPLVEEEEFHGIEGVFVAGDEIALGEQRFECGDDEVVCQSLEGFGIHGIRPCKSIYPNSLTNPHKTLVHPNVRLFASLPVDEFCFSGRMSRCYSLRSFAVRSGKMGLLP